MTGGKGGSPRGWRSVGGRGGGLRSEHMIVTCIIVAAVLAIGLSMPSTWFDSVLAWLGFR